MLNVQRYQRAEIQQLYIVPATFRVDATLLARIYARVYARVYCEHLFTRQTAGCLSCGVSAIQSVYVPAAGCGGRAGGELRIAGSARIRSGRRWQRIWLVPTLVPRSVRQRL